MRLPALLLSTLLLCACGKPVPAGAGAEVAMPAPAGDSTHAAPVKAGFDCTAARGYAETTVCGNAALAALDAELATLYRQLDDNGALSSEVKAAQRAWLVERNDCGDPACLADAYTRRIKALSSGAAQ